MAEVLFHSSMLFTGQNIPLSGCVGETVEMIYDQDVLDLRKERSYIGMWQMWQCSNIIGRPLRSVFPMQGSYAFQSDFDRLCPPPIDVRKQHKVPLNIMWTPVRVDSDVVHFVPLMRKI